MTEEGQWEITVRFNEPGTEEFVAPIHEEDGDLETETNEGENVVVEGDRDIREDREAWREVQDKVEDLTVRTARHFEDANGESGWQPPMVKTPLQPTREEWLTRPLIHTPYAPWCKHWNAARAVRANHQRADERAKLVADIDKSIEGPVGISMDSMSMRDRVGTYNGSNWTPPYRAVVEHRHGRVWAYQTPNKGFNEEAEWLLARILQD